MESWEFDFKVFDNEEDSKENIMNRINCDAVIVVDYADEYKYKNLILSFYAAAPVFVIANRSSENKARTLKELESYFGRSLLVFPD